MEQIIRPTKRRYKVIGYTYDGYYSALVEAYSKQGAIDICREKHKHLIVVEFYGNTLGEVDL